MPYIDSKEVAKRRKAIKEAFPAFKFSVTRHHFSMIRVVILEGPLDFPKYYKAESDRRHINVNPFYVEEHFGKFPEWRDVLLKIVAIAREGVEVLTEDGDYGSVPTFYYDVLIGDWDRPYVEKKAA